MGYENNERPKKLKFLIADLRMDFEDIIHHIPNKKVSREQLLEYVSFMNTTYDKILNKLEKKYDITIFGGTDND